MSKGIAIAIGLAALQAAAAAQSTPAPQQPASVTSERLRAEEIQVPEPYEERMRREGQVLEMTLSDAIRLALVNNLDIAIQNYAEELTRRSIIQTRGFYDPQLSFSVGYQDSTAPTVSVLDAGENAAASKQTSFAWDTSFSQEIPKGGRLSLSFNNFRSATNSTFSFLNPAFGTDFRVTFTQPLWRGFRQTSTERLLKLQNLDQKVDDLDFEQRVAETIQVVQNQYWELVFAIDNYETQRLSMGLAITQHKNNQTRVRIGVSAPIDITSSRAEVASREQEMIFSEVSIIRAQNGLKKLLAPDPQASIWNLTLIPTDRPTTPPIDQTLPQAIETAIERRPELKKYNVQIERYSIDRKYYRREGKPTVDARFTFNTAARTGDTLVDTNGDDKPDTVVPVGNLGNSILDAFKFNFNTWAIFADVRIPLRNRANDSALAMVSIRERRTLSELKNEQQAIIVEVRNAYEGLKTQKKRLEAARLARQLSEEQLRGENKRFESGLSTNFNVLRFQRDLTLAKAQELRALIDYEQAVAALKKATYTIIEDSDIMLARNGDSQ